MAPGSPTAPAPGRRADRGERDRQARDVARRGGDEQAGGAEQREEGRGRAQAPAVDGAAAERHRRQGAGADEQQRGPELPVAHARLVADRRDRRAPGAPERAEHGEAGEGHPRAYATAAKVRRAARRLGYPGPHPGARSLRRGRTGTLGVVLGEPLTYAFDDPQAARFLAGVAGVCAARRVGLTLVPITGAADDAERVAEAAVDGFVVWTTADDDPVVDAVAATGLPAVVHAGPGRRGLPVVGIDDRAAARAIGAEAFAGARRPAVIGFPLDRDRRAATLHGPDPTAATFPVTRRRLEGLRDACIAAGGTWERVPVRVCARNRAAEGEAAADDLMGGPDPPDAIAAMSDELALGALRAAARAGVAVPGALAVTGWDDTEAAAPAGLTTVAQSLHDQGARCALLALGGADDGGHEAGWRIVRRASTRA